MEPSCRDRRPRRNSRRRFVPRGHRRPIRRRAERQDQAAGDPAAGPHQTQPSRGRHTRGPSHPPSAPLHRRPLGVRAGCTPVPRPPGILPPRPHRRASGAIRQPASRPLFNQASDRRCPACHSRSGHGARAGSNTPRSSYTVNTLDSPHWATSILASESRMICVLCATATGRWWYWRVDVTEFCGCGGGKRVPSGGSGGLARDQGCSGVGRGYPCPGGAGPCALKGAYHLP